MIDRLRLYLKLEAEMILLDRAGDPLAERVRDLLDPIWYSLSDTEREFLDRRVFVEAGRQIRLPATYVIISTTEGARSTLREPARFPLKVEAA